VCRCWPRTRCIPSANLDRHSMSLIAITMGKENNIFVCFRWSCFQMTVVFFIFIT
jgi:hypothetical protein